MSKLEISLEYASLRLPGHCPLGVWVIPSPDDIHHWCGTLFIHRGYYAGGIYKFTIDFSRNYPFDRQTPQINFQTDCFHPLIDQANHGLFNLALKFPEWLPHENFICNLLYYLKSCFKRPGLESIIASGDDSIAFNKHAFRLYRDQTDVFATLAAQSSSLSSSPTSLYDQTSSSLQQSIPASSPSEDSKKLSSKDNGESRSSPANKSKHLIKFNPLDDDQFKQLKQKIFLEF
ncbi:hypothetical protein PTTG_01118 [Puccinia triticina 1-1 BBBD Race 1]|uniref:UBC core domain-containing protein n=2 Tax=Puccinia triticina TaxID=208348 RepID=A0A0C4EK45_PUCT1|nr:uncharacterized protein PtA15_10A596 [Puccinia triticina]OAV88073.1 hypothetical protein PTTG_01118 [Puccinia triticina 1-1 BBBD Race 1]WAQ89172.1 hypothetical protein PtA15_10A596 [Puccinia triticina]WAR59230.1 hypothetical protein PtB15_10B572 [Puccinia triticina]